MDFQRIQKGDKGMEEMAGAVREVFIRLGLAIFSMET